MFWRPEGKRELSKRDDVRRTALDENGEQFLSLLPRDDRNEEAEEISQIRNQCADAHRLNSERLENVNIRVDFGRQKVKN